MWINPNKKTFFFNGQNQIHILSSTATSGERELYPPMPKCVVRVKVLARGAKGPVRFHCSVLTEPLSPPLEGNLFPLCPDWPPPSKLSQRGCPQGLWDKAVDELESEKGTPRAALSGPRPPAFIRPAPALLMHQRKEEVAFPNVTKYFVLSGHTALGLLHAPRSPLITLVFQGCRDTSGICE